MLQAIEIVAFTSKSYIWKKLPSAMSLKSLDSTLIYRFGGHDKEDPLYLFEFFGGVVFIDFSLHNTCRQYTLIEVKFQCVQYGIYCLWRGIKTSPNPKNFTVLCPPPFSEIPGSTTVRGFSLCTHYYKFCISVITMSLFAYICVICRLFVHDEESILLKLLLRLYDTVGDSEKYVSSRSLIVLHMDKPMFH